MHWKQLLLNTVNLKCQVTDYGKHFIDNDMEILYFFGREG